MKVPWKAPLGKYLMKVPLKGRYIGKAPWEAPLGRCFKKVPWEGPL